MKKAGCLIALLGLGVFLVSLALFGKSIVRAFQARCVHTAALELGKTTTTDLMEVSTERACQVAIEVDVKSSSVQEEQDFDETDYSLRYSFPVTYKVADADGKELLSEQTELRWNKGTRITHNERVGRDGGTATVQHNLEKFDVPPPGKIQVEAEVQPDTEYGAEAQGVRLEVYDNVTRHGSSLAGGVALLIAGMAVGVLGLILFIIGAARGKSQAAG